jgi:hypothetical protein
MMTFPTEWKNKSHVPNHQSDIDLYSSANLMAGNNEKKMSRPEFIQFPYGLED